MTPVPAAGASPVSVPGAGYELATALAPDAAQIIPLEIELPAPITTPHPTAAKTTITPSATLTVVPSIKMGETITLRTGVIYDKNHNAVPDGTEVKFLFTAGASDNGLVQQVTANTAQGVARTVYRIQNIGALEIRVVSEPAMLSRVLRLNISASGAVAITAVTPTSQPTLTPTPTVTHTPSPTATSTPPPPPAPPPHPGAGQWRTSHLIIAAGVVGFFYLGKSSGSMRWGVRWALLAASGGLLMYSYLAVGLPGSSTFTDTYGDWGILWLTTLGVLLGWLAGWAWRRWMQTRARQEPTTGKRQK